MKEDLNFKGNELTQINTVFTVGESLPMTSDKGEVSKS